MLRSRLHRVASLIITFFGTSINFIVAAQLLAAWRSFKWEQESEWEMLGDKWRVDGVKVVWILLSSYFASSAAVSAVGLAGVIKNKASLVRFYRDYSIADFSFCTVFATTAVYAAFHTTARAGICEEFSRHPELMRDVLEVGLNVENCELWLERAVLALAAILFTIIIIRLHFLLAVSSYYSYLSRHTSRICCSASSREGNNTLYARSLHTRSDSNGSRKRIYLLPRTHLSDDMELVYAPVPINRLTIEQRSQAKEAWVSESSSSSSSPVEQQQQHHHHHHSRRHSRSNSASSRQHRTGTIFLPIQPGEGLLPAYSVDVQRDFAKV
ncbi:hypothetical protein AMATHDRAFT_183464 [Amanita thiersii Skay4041]|uniref:Uncharacterized protein n=1 Tax=Amanita thiersii Skay4041 TaxID=703135 RepID=A0A2A9NDV0_9AGAR|nr:hypothetical protein AMATHDRAFT_183464 [Amanita thiersii Skay4041]